jgi:hypothetical protein
MKGLGDDALALVVSRACAESSAAVAPFSKNVFRYAYELSSESRHHESLGKEPE